MDAATYKLDELADEAGVSARTVRYYVQRGLLPGPTFRGKDSSYGQEHLVRLRAIKRLQEQFLPLDAIQEALAQRTIEQIERLVDGRDVLSPVPVSTPPSAVESPRKATWQRFSITPGLELHLESDAPEHVRRLAEKLMNEAAQERPSGRGGSKS
jgi:DNA-binding transcriptional MerR regulator